MYNCIKGNEIDCIGKEVREGEKHNLNRQDYHIHNHKMSPEPFQPQNYTKFIEDNIEQIKGHWVILVNLVFYLNYHKYPF